MEYVIEYLENNLDFYSDSLNNAIEKLNDTNASNISFMLYIEDKRIAEERIPQLEKAIEILKREG